MNIKERKKHIQECIAATEWEISTYTQIGISKKEAIKRTLKSFEEAEKDETANEDGGYTIAIEYLKKLTKNTK